MNMDLCMRKFGGNWRNWSGIIALTQVLRHYWKKSVKISFNIE